MCKGKIFDKIRESGPIGYQSTTASPMMAKKATRHRKFSRAFL